MHGTEGPNLLDKLGFLVRFWELKARHALLGAPLMPHEQLELLSLMQLVTGDAKVPEAGPVARHKNAVPAQLIGEGTIAPIEIRGVSAAALVAAALKAVPAGSRVVVRAADAVSGVEYALPCTVVWSWDGAPCTLALIVDGIPTRSDFATGSDVHVRSGMTMGRHETLVG
jgi:hypothetical protein